MYQPYPGSTEMPESRRPSAPASVLNAVKVMYAGAAASLVGIIVDITTLSATKSAIEKHAHNLTASQINSEQHVLVASFIIGGVIGAGLWIFLAQSCKRGRNWARITGTVLFGIATLDTFVGVALPVAGAIRIYAVVVWLIGLTAVVLLWQRSSSAFFRQEQP
jgi:hypothetical protein